MGNSASSGSGVYTSPQADWRLLRSTQSLHLYREPDGYFLSGDFVLLCSPMGNDTNLEELGNSSKFLQLAKDNKLEVIERCYNALCPYLDIRSLTRPCLQQLSDLLQRSNFSLPPVCALASAGYADALMEGLAFLDVMARDERGYTALHFSVKPYDVDTARPARPSPRCVDVLLGHPACAALVAARTRDGQTALHLAAEVGTVAIIDKFIQRRCDLELTDLQGRTALHVAVAKDHADAVVCLVAGHADLAARAQGKSCIHIAAEANACSTLNVLLSRYHADVRALTDQGETALHCAAAGSSQRVARLLLDAGVDPVAKNFVDQETALHYAAKRGEIGVSGIILAACPRAIAVTNAREETPLHVAVELRKEFFVKMVCTLEGAAPFINFDAHTWKGKTLLELGEGSDACMRWLLHMRVTQLQAENTALLALVGGSDADARAQLTAATAANAASAALAAASAAAGAFAHSHAGAGGDGVSGSDGARRAQAGSAAGSAAAGAVAGAGGAGDAELQRRVEELERVAEAHTNMVTCAVCMGANVEIAFGPCGHVCACSECAAQLRSCPLCRATISQKLRVYVQT